MRTALLKRLCLLCRPFDSSPPVVSGCATRSRLTSKDMDRRSRSRCILGTTKLGLYEVLRSIRPDHDLFPLTIANMVSAWIQVEKRHCHQDCAPRRIQKVISSYTTPSPVPLVTSFCALCSAVSYFPHSLELFQRTLSLCCTFPINTTAFVQPIYLISSRTRTPSIAFTNTVAT